MKGNRNANGEGSIFQVSKNQWKSKIQMGVGRDGKPIVKQFSGATEAIVKKKLKDFKKSVAYTEKHVPCQDTDFIERHAPVQDTVQAYFAMWLREYQYHKLKPSSFDRLESTVLE